MNDRIKLAKSLFQNILGIKPTRAKLGHGSFITIDFGRDIPKKVKTRNGIVTRYFGEWYLWVYMCAWRFDKNKKPFIGSEDSREKIEKSLIELANKKLTQVEIFNDSFDSTLVFEDIELHLFATHTYKKEQWMLFTPEKKVFTAGPGSEWSFEESD